MKRLAKRMLIFLTSVLVILIVGVFIHNRIAQHAMIDDVTRVERDPVTNVVRGTEALTLHGEGEDAVLVVHGFAGSRIEMGTGMEDLQDMGFTVRLMRLPGHGTFPVDHATTTADELLASVRDEYHQLRQDHKRIYLLAFSMGAAISSIVAAEENPDGLILISPYFGVTHKWYYVLPVETWNRLMSWCVPYVIKTNSFIQVNREEVKPLIYSYNLISTRASATAMELAREARDPENLSRIECPVLVLQSHGDDAASPKATERAFPLMGSEDKKIVWYENSNHILLWDYDREAAQQEIVDFLREHTSNSRSHSE